MIYLKYQKEKNLQPRILYPAMLFRTGGEIKRFLDKQELNVFITTKVVLQKVRNRTRNKKLYKGENPTGKGCGSTSIS